MEDSDQIKETAQRADEILQKLLESEGGSSEKKIAEPISKEATSKTRGLAPLLLVGGTVMALTAVGTAIVLSNPTVSTRLDTGLPRLNSEKQPSPNSPTFQEKPERDSQRYQGQEGNSQATPKGHNSRYQDKTQDCGEWGCADSYKFGRIPDNEYPQSCAFSRTDKNGLTIVSRSTLDFWACRDEGGDPYNGYSVSWVDGKRTKYTFNPGGNGLMVGTDGRGYPMRWTNSSHQGSDIIVINHESGAESWIPGSVNF